MLDKTLKVLYHRNQNNGLELFVYRNGGHILTLAIKKDDDFTVYKGKDNMMGKCRKCGNYVYEIFYMPFRKIKHNYCATCKTENALSVGGQK